MCITSEGESLVKWPHQLAFMQYLEELSIYNQSMVFCFVDGLDLSSQKMMFTFEWPNLVRLILGNNKFTVVPGGIDNLPSLKYLSMNDNHINFIHDTGIFSDYIDNSFPDVGGS